MTIDKEKQMNEDKAKDLLAIADGLIKSIKNYDKGFNLARDEYHTSITQQRVVVSAAVSRLQPKNRF